MIGRTASEVLRSLEMRVAILEKSAGDTRIIKSHPRSNDDVIQKAQETLWNHLMNEGHRNEWWDGELNFRQPKFKGIRGNEVVLSVEWVGTLIYNSAGREVIEYSVDIKTGKIKIIKGGY